jgi:hypothetical protein
VLFPSAVSKQIIRFLKLWGGGRLFNCFSSTLLMSDRNFVLRLEGGGRHKISVGIRPRQSFLHV